MDYEFTAEDEAVETFLYDRSRKLDAEGLQSDVLLGEMKAAWQKNSQITQEHHNGHLPNGRHVQ